MENSMKLNDIINEIEKLDYEGKITLMSKILSLLKPKEIQNPHTRITLLKGLGKTVWKKTAIDAYIANERETWE